jgi:N-acetylmuramoyl-L-alanine amidase
MGAYNNLRSWIVSYLPFASVASQVTNLINSIGVSAMDFLSKQTFLNFLNREKIVASNKLAIDVQRGMLTYAKSKYSHTVDGGVKEAPFWVLVGALMPAVLIEIGYVTNPEDAEKLSEDYYKALLAKGIMEGIENYFHNN